MATSGVAFEVSGLSVRFGGLQALNTVDLAVKPGTIAGLIGPNGAGKTTLFNVVSGFVKPASGSIRVDGHEVTGIAPSERGSLGLVRTFQQVGVVREKTVIDNVFMAQHRMMRSGLIAGILGRASEEESQMVLRAEETLERLSLERYAKRQVRDLPHGVHKLVELACALVREPRLLLLDEPSAGLDPAETGDLADRLHEIQAERGFTTLVIDHDMRLVRRLAKDINVLSFGLVIARGTWKQVRSNKDVIAAYLGKQTEKRKRTRHAARAR